MAKIHINKEDMQDRTKRYLGDLHARLRENKVLVIGAGAVGTEVIKNLIMLGVSNISVVDFDKVSNSNLNRCIFFRPEDHNKTYKVDAIIREIKSVWKDVNVKGYKTKIQDAPEEVWDTPLIIVGVDNNEARHFINLRALASSDMPFIINGAMGRTFIEVKTLLPGSSACLLCSWTKDYFEKFIHEVVKQDCDMFFHKTKEFFPSISILNSILGGIISTEAVKILIGLDSWKKEKKWQPEHIPAIGKVIRYDIREHEFSIGKIYPNPDCVEIMCKKFGSDRK